MGARGRRGRGAAGRPPRVGAAADALIEELDDGWLRDQVVGLRTYAGALAGESGSYAVEVEGYYGVRPTFTDDEGGAALAAVLHDAGIAFDLDRALAVERAIEPCGWAEANAALMLHEQGASEDETHAYLERWGLMNTKLAAHMIRFLNERPHGHT